MFRSSPATVALTDGSCRCGVYFFAVETREGDTVDFAESIGVEAQPRDKTCGSRVGFREHDSLIDGNGDLLLFDPHFYGMPVVDVAGEGREIVGFSIEKVIAELCANAAGATGQGEGAKHKMLLAVDLGHDPGARGVSDLRHSYPCFEPEVVGIGLDGSGEEGIEIDLRFLRIDLVIDDHF